MTIEDWIKEQESKLPPNASIIERLMIYEPALTYLQSEVERLLKIAGNSPEPPEKKDPNK